MENQCFLSDLAIPVTISKALSKSDCLASASESAQLDTQLLLAHALAKETSYLYTWPDKELTEAELECFSDLMRKRQKGEPVAYLLGYQDFWSLRLEVSKDTLIPRPDTELLVETALSVAASEVDCQGFASSSLRVADLGTGTGAVALSLASEMPSWQVVASDYLEAAVALAQRNAQRLRINNVELLTGSWFEPHVGKYHLIVSNPPYIDPHDRHLKEGDVRFEPLSALTAADSGLRDLAEIVEQAPEYLAKNGYLIMEHGYDQGALVSQLFTARGFVQVHTLKDLAANDRVTLGQWCSSVTGA